MGLFGNSYSKAGPGIAKDAPQKKAFFHFFEVYFRKFTKILALSLLYFLFCLPIVTIGPATAGFVKVLRNYSMEKHAFLWMDFIEAFRKNFKQSLIVGLVNTLFTVSFIVGLQLYPIITVESKLYYVPYALSFTIFVTMIIMNFYIYLMIVSVNLPLKNIVKNAFILSCLGFKTTLLTLLFVAIPVVGTFLLAYYVNMPFLLLYPVLITGLVWFIITYNCYPVIQKYVINPYYEALGRDNPEYDYLKPLEEEETVFEDMGGKEQPINLANQGKKGKTIS